MYEALRKTDVAIGSWLSAALNDPKASDEFKTAIQQWFDARPAEYFHGGKIDG